MKITKSQKTKAARIVAIYEEIQAVAADPEFWTLGEPLGAERVRELAGVYADHIPADLWALVTLVGDGGVILSKYFPSFEQLVKQAGDRWSRAFPLTQTWLNPIEHDPEKPWQTGLKPSETKYIYPFPEGNSYEDGSVEIGVTSDNSVFLLALRGETAGRVWLDAQGQDGGGILVSNKKERFAIKGKPVKLLDYILVWAERMLERQTAAAEKRKVMQEGTRAVIAGDMAPEDFELPASEIYYWYRDNPPFEPEALRAAALINAAQTADDIGSDVACYTGWYWGMAGEWERMLESSLEYWRKREGMSENRVHQGDTALTHARIAAVMCDQLDAVRDTAYRNESEYYHVHGGQRLADLMYALPPAKVAQVFDVIGPELCFKLFTRGRIHKQDKNWRATSAWLDTLSNPAAILLRQLDRVRKRVAEGEFHNADGRYKTRLAQRSTWKVRTLFEHPDRAELAWFHPVEAQVKAICAAISDGKVTLQEAVVDDWR